MTYMRTRRTQLSSKFSFLSFSFFFFGCYLIGQDDPVYYKGIIVFTEEINSEHVQDVWI